MNVLRPSIPGPVTRHLTVNQRFRDTTATEPKAKVICFPDPMAMVLRGGVEADDVAETTIMRETNLHRFPDQLTGARQVMHHDERDLKQIWPLAIALTSASSGQ